MKTYYVKNFNEVIERNLQIKQPNLVFKEFLQQYQKPVTPSQHGSESPLSPSPPPTDQNLSPLGQIDEPITELDKKTKLWIFPCYMKPGKHYFTVRLDPPNESSHGRPSIRSTPKRIEGAEEITSSKSFLSSSHHSMQTLVEYYSHSTIAPFRSEDIPVHVKTYGTLTKEVSFKKNKSVFKDWKENTGSILNACCEHDFKNWKVRNIPRFKPGTEAGGPEEYAKVEELIQKNFEALKIIHITLASENSFPYASTFNINQFL